MARFIALYLPQYHPIPENDEWWGKGFTEWTNVARAKRLFPGHKQPRIPTELGFYDLRLPEVREQQAELAREHGVEAFCYYDYWFGNNKRLLERPIDEVIKTGKPEFPFCLSWANGSWYNKKWDPKAPGKDKLLIKQEYQGEKDYESHFYALLEAFKDARYVKINGSLFYMICEPFDTTGEIKTFIQCWRRLAKINGLGDFFFVGQDTDSRHKKELLDMGFDAIVNVDVKNVHHHFPTWKKVALLLIRKVLRIPTVVSYKKAIDYMVIEDCRSREVIPSVSPNWDHTPRSRHNGFVLTGATPQLFKKLVIRAIGMVKEKPKEEQIIIIKSWNEWGEGNYMEPDMLYGRGYLEALKEAIETTV